MWDEDAIPYTRKIKQYFVKKIIIQLGVFWIQISTHNLLSLKIDQ